MSLVSQKAPLFVADAVLADGKIGTVDLSAVLTAGYAILLFYPLDFTFVCPSELVAFSDAAAEFAKRGAQVLGISVDSVHTHAAWRRTPRTQGGVGNLTFPLVSDLKRTIAAQYGVLRDGVALRGLFLIDSQGTVQHALVNNLSLGRDVQEALRVLDALIFTEKHGEVCPANWKPGKDAMKPTHEGVAAYLGEQEKAKK